MQEEREVLLERIRVSETMVQQEALATETQMAGIQSQIRSVASVREKIKVWNRKNCVGCLLKKKNQKALSGESSLSEDELRSRYERAVQENASLKTALNEAQQKLDQMLESEKELNYRRLSNATHQVAQENLESRISQLTEQHAQEAKKAAARIVQLEKEITVMEEEVLTLEKEVARLKEAEKKLAGAREEKKAAEARDAAVITKLKNELDAMKLGKSKDQSVLRGEIDALKQARIKEQAASKAEVDQAKAKEAAAKAELDQQIQKSKAKEAALMQDLEKLKKATQEEQKAIQTKGKKEREKFFVCFLFLK